MTAKELQTNLVYALKQSKPFPFTGDAKNTWLNTVDELRKVNTLSNKQYKELFFGVDNK